MPKGERAFEINEVSERDKECVQRRVVKPLVSIGRLMQCGGPRITDDRTGQNRVGMLDERVDDVRVELAAAAAANHGHGAVDSVRAVVHFDHVGELSHPHLYRDVVAVRASGQATAVVSLESERERRLDIGA